MARCDGCLLPLVQFERNDGLPPTGRKQIVVEPLLLSDARAGTTFSFHDYDCMGRWMIDQRHVWARYDGEGEPMVTVGAGWQ